MRETPSANTRAWHRYLSVGLGALALPGENCPDTSRGPDAAPADGVRRGRHFLRPKPTDRHRHGRSAALAVIAEAGLEIYELAPRKVKQAIVGYGAAQKFAVARMVQRMLHLPSLPAPDAADALALALAHAQESGRYTLEPRKRI